MRSQPIVNPTRARDNKRKKGADTQPCREREWNPRLRLSKALTPQTLLTFRLAKLPGLNGVTHRLLFVMYAYMCIHCSAVTNFSQTRWACI
jgi:hypothetical protein